MISARRPLRGLSALLLLLSPGVGGQALALLHPCPAAVAAVAAVAATQPRAGMPAMAHHGHGMPEAAPATPVAPADGHQHAGTCDCLGNCHTPALVSAPQELIVSVAFESIPRVRASWPAIESAVPSRPVDRLPPPPAPPSA